MSTLIWELAVPGTCTYALHVDRGPEWEGVHAASGSVKTNLKGGGGIGLETGSADLDPAANTPAQRDSPIRWERPWGEERTKGGGILLGNISAVGDLIGELRSESLLAGCRTDCHGRPQDRQLGKRSEPGRFKAAVNKKRAISWLLPRPPQRVEAIQRQLRFRQ